MRAGIALRLLALLLLAPLAHPGPARAHDVPPDIALSAFVRIQPEEVVLLVRVPLVLLGTLDLPLRGPGWLDLDRMGPAIEQAGAVVGRALLLADAETPLPQRFRHGRISLPSDRSFDTAAAALAHIRGPPLPATETVIATQGFFDAEYVVAAPAPIGALTLLVALPPGLADRLRLGLRLELPDGTVRPFEIRGAEASLRLDPDALYAARRFLLEGMGHILGGIDHLLFLLCLVVPLRHAPWRLAGVVTAFTLGHSVTLVAAALGLAPAGAWFAPLVETLIAASILWTAVENALGRFAISRPLLAAGFGLVHGFGFAGALADGLQFAGGHLLLALGAFNLGIELGQLLAILVALPLLNLAFRAPALARFGPLLVAILVGHAAWHWLEERARAIPLPDLMAAIAEIEPLRAAAWVATAVMVMLVARALRPAPRAAAE